MDQTQFTSHMPVSLASKRKFASESPERLAKSTDCWAPPRVADIGGATNVHV